VCTLAPLLSRVLSCLSPVSVCCVCTTTYTYACTSCTCVCMCACVCMYMCMYVCVLVCACVCWYVCMCMCIMSLSLSRSLFQVGYCQSLNIIAAVLLCFLNEERAFHTLAAICELLAPGNYCSNMIETIVDQGVFHKLMERFHPTLLQKLDELGMPLAALTQSWFLCLFIGYVPLAMALRVLDLFFLLGGRALFAFGLAMFKVGMHVCVCVCVYRCVYVCV
jgi:Rab-GTPase-TBC domain